MAETAMATGHQGADASPDGRVTVASVRDAPRADDGYYGPGSVTWKVISHPAALNIGGVLAVLLQALDPGEMRHLSRTSIANEGPEQTAARLNRTSAFLITVNFGDRAHADAAAAHVDRLHELAVYTDPVTGETTRAKTTEWLQWTYDTFVWGALTATTAYGLELTPEEQDRFVVEQQKLAELLHVPGPLPATRAELDAVIESWQDRAALILPAAKIAIGLRNPAKPGQPIKNWVTRNTQYGLLALLPAWALELYGVDGLDERRIRTGRRWMGMFMKLSTKNRTMAQLIEDAAADATVHPYQKVRPQKPGAQLT
jgi:uncharacterized protein (DUF2236 family)